jgi:hypothetical protein
VDIVPAQERKPDYWLGWTLLFWLAFCAWAIYSKWGAIHWFALSDTDDNMRMMQVRAMLGGQDWFDLRQYRMNPPMGADIHWSHLVDLPIAGIILLTKPFVGGIIAEKIAIAIAPLLPLAVVMTALGLAARRLIAPGAWILAGPIFLCSVMAMTYFMPTRIDHHGWQLAMLAVIMAGLSDAKAMRGGLTVGTATALSLTIGLETLPWLAIAGMSVVLHWIYSVDQAQRLRGYGLSIAGGTGIGYLLFASYANRTPRCDALTPVYLTTMVVSGALLILLSVLRIRKLNGRLGLAVGIGVIVMLFFVTAWPQCAGRPEQVSPELQRLWLDEIGEVQPIYTRSWTTILAASALILGLIGNLWSLWRNRFIPIVMAWLPIALFSVGSALMLLFQTRFAATALLFSVPGAAAIGWQIVPRLRAHSSVFVRTFGVVAAFLLVSGLGLQILAGMIPAEKVKTGRKQINKADGTCPTLTALRPIGRLPKAVIFTFVDLGPRIITVTHHDVIAGPYHRNGDAILDVHHAFRGSADTARNIITRHGATLLLICPNMSESTIYKVQNPDGFYAQIIKGKLPDWLEPVALPSGSPFQLWRVRPQASSTRDAS